MEIIYAVDWLYEVLSGEADMKEYAIEGALPSRHAIGDYLVLAKPGIVSLVMMSALTGLCIASRGLPDLLLTISVMTGIALATAGSAMLNNYFDRDIDAIMERTQSRARAVEAFSPVNTVITGILLVVISLVFLSYAVNSMTAILTGAAASGYVVLYTIILKRRSSYANQVGGIAGALPPVIGYVAVTQRVDLTAVILFAVSAVWQHPHALSIALKYRDQYASARIPVIPVAKGVSSTKEKDCRIYCITIGCKYYPIYFRYGRLNLPDCCYYCRHLLSWTCCKVYDVET